MKDQMPRQRYLDKAGIVKETLYMIAVIGLVILTFAAVYRIWANQPSYKPDGLVSNEMVEYLSTYGHGKDFSEGDMQ